MDTGDTAVGKKMTSSSFSWQNMFDKVLFFLFIQPTFSYNIFNPCQSGIRQDGINYLQCARKSFKEIPQFSSPKFVVFDELILSENAIEHIPEYAFHGLRIKRLIMLSNPLKSVDQNAFDELQNSLEELILEFNPSVVQTVLPANLINLKSLTLINFNLPHLTKDYFYQMKKLVHLTLKSCRIESITSQGFISIEKQLRTLILDGNQLNEKIFSQLNHLTGLEKLSLTHNRIEHINLHWFNSHLQYLDLSYNSIKTINFSSSCQQLKQINLQNNRLTIDSLHGPLPSSVKQIYFDFNSIEYFPDNFFLEQNALEILSLENNDFSLTNSDVFQNLNQLKKLNLARNNIQLIPRSIRFPSTLEELILDRNPLFPFSNATFSALAHSLKNFSCQSCSLTSSSLIAFSSLKNLQSLKLSSNYLTEIIPENLFSSMINLRLLDLQRNYLRRFPSEYPASLHELQLEHNRLRTLTNLPNLNLFDISSNPLRCDCQIKSIHHWLLTHYESELIRHVQWICDQPKQYHGRQLGSLLEHQLICQENSSKILSFNLTLKSANSVVLEWIMTSSNTSLKLSIFENNLRLKSIDFNQINHSYLVDNLKPKTNYSFCLYISRKLHCRFLTTNNLHIELFFLAIAFGMIFILLITLFFLIQSCIQQRKYSVESYAIVDNGFASVSTCYPGRQDLSNNA